MQYKLGKLPHRKGAITFKLSQYENTAQLPTPPRRYGYQKMITNWGMLGNDQYGDCVLAGAGHEHMLWNKEAGKDVNFTVQNVLAAYSAITGFNPNDPNSDQGTDMQQAASYRRKTGIIDAQGIYHKVGAYLQIQNGNIDQLKRAMYMYGVVGIGIQFPDSAMDQFNQNKSWSVRRGATIEGGHYIPCVGYDSQYIYVVTWGKVQPCTYAFIKKYMDEGVVYLSQEFLKDGKSLDGFDLATLTKDLNSL